MILKYEQNLTTFRNFSSVTPLVTIKGKGKKTFFYIKNDPQKFNSEHFSNIYELLS